MQVTTNEIPWLNVKGVPLIKGNFDQVHPAKLLYGFFKARKTGALVIDDGIVKQYLYICRGCLVFYERGVFEEREFGRHLQMQGLITEDELIIYRKMAREQNTSLIELLIEKQLLDRKFVRRIAETFYAKSCRNIFSWRRGAYTFYEVGLPTCESQVDDVQALRWIVDGIREHYYHGMIEQRLEKRMNTPLRPASRPPVKIDELVKNDNERKIVALLENGVTLNKLMSEPGLSSTDARAFVFGLLIVEVCKFASGAKRKQRESREVEALPSDPLQALYRIAEASVERIKKEVAREETEIPVVTTRPIRRRVEAAIETEDAAEELRRRLKEKLSQLTKIASDYDEPDEAAKIVPEEVETVMSPEEISAKHKVTIEELGDLDSGDPFAESHEDEQVLDEMDMGEFDEALEEPEPEEAPATEEEPDNLVMPDEIDKVLDESGEMELGDLDSMIEEDAGLFDDRKPILFAPEDPPDKILQLGISLVEQEIWQKAREVIETAIDRGSVDPAAKIYMGLALYHDLEDDPERFKKAAAWVQEGISQNPKLAIGHVSLGKLYLDENDKDMAELFFVRALEVDRDCIEAKELIRKIYQER